MIKAVLDTNVLLSALLAADGEPARILDMILNGSALICYDSRIILEYREVLSLPELPFRQRDAGILLDTVTRIGVSILAEPLEMRFPDAGDKKFLEVAQSAGAYLVTGNNRHYPEDKSTLSPAEFMEHLYIHRDK
ncbi:MAG: putative toxin-antitoxin system toxin component, PIN family [Oscillospiraceae bacterium]|jgi:putative PIN family toxin of toxin-antitoxin system|nr:putative toxin-antitoxin system toxin component, PIN family [Oscillospiraceae bacterium]